MLGSKYSHGMLESDTHILFYLWDGAKNKAKAEEANKRKAVEAAFVILPCIGKKSRRPLL